MEPSTSSRLPMVALACGVLGVAAAVWMYWLVVPGVILGIAAIVLGLRARRDGPSEAGSVAAALGFVAILLVPSVLFVASESESYGRDCALNPTQSDC